MELTRRTLFSLSAAAAAGLMFGNIGTAIGAKNPSTNSQERQEVSSGILCTVIENTTGKVLTEAFVTAVDKDDSFIVDVPGKGRHEIRLTPLTAIGDERISVVIDRMSGDDGREIVHESVVVGTTALALRGLGVTLIVGPVPQGPDLTSVRP